MGQLRSSRFQLQCLGPTGESLITALLCALVELPQLPLHGNQTQASHAELGPREAVLDIHLSCRSGLHTVEIFHSLLRFRSIHQVLDRHHSSRFFTYLVQGCRSTLRRPASFLDLAVTSLLLLNMWSSLMYWVTASERRG